MTVSLRFKEIVKINTNKHGKFNCEGNELAIKTTPAVRYALKRDKNETKISEETSQFINTCISTFNSSIHIIEILIDGKESIEYIKDIQESLGEQIHVFAYINITDTEIDNNDFAEDIIESIETMPKVEKIQLKDNSTKLHTESFMGLKNKIIKYSPINKREIGVCSSPLSFGDKCCLTAIKLRDLQSYKDEQIELPVVPKTHQEGYENGCSCVRYLDVNNDLDIIHSKEKTTKKLGSKTSKENTKSSKSLKVIPTTNF